LAVALVGAAVVITVDVRGANDEIYVLGSEAIDLRDEAEKASPAVFCRIVVRLDQISSELMDVSSRHRIGSIFSDIKGRSIIAHDNVERFESEVNKRRITC
jgi:hypothetical protein